MLADHVFVFFADHLIEDHDGEKEKRKINNREAYILLYDFISGLKSLTLGTKEEAVALKLKDAAEALKDPA